MKRHAQRLFAIAWLTVQAARRMRFVLAAVVLLFLCVTLLPFVIKHNGTARMFTQVLLTYSLYLCFGLLSLATLWLACGLHATDVEPGQLQLLAVKPAARWHIWAGRWLGIMVLNTVLLAVAGGAAFGLLRWQARGLAPEERRLLETEVLVARGAAREASPLRDEDVEKVLAEKQRRASGETLDAEVMRREICADLRARHEVTPPNYRRIWDIDFAKERAALAGQPLQLRVRFHAAQRGSDALINTVWVAGRPESGRFWRAEKQLAADTFHEFAIPPDLIGADGRLHVECENRDRVTLIFPIDDGLEVLFREGGFAANYTRALLVLLCWLALLTALGLMAASFLSLIIAALFAVTLLAVGLSGDTFAEVASNNTLMGVDHDTGRAVASSLNVVAVPFYRVLAAITQPLAAVSPVESLSEGRSITWAQVAGAFARIVLLGGGGLAAVGLMLFHRRELAQHQAAA